MTQHYFTDLGNAERLIQRFGSDVRFCYEWGTWFIWNGAIWEEDDSQEILRMARSVVRDLYIAASEADDLDMRKQITKWATASEDRRRLLAMTELAKSEKGIPVQHTDLNQDPMKIACTNGTLNLVNGTLEPFQRAHLITRRLDVIYDPDAQAPLWDAFLNQIFAGNADLIAYVQRCIGYSLTGDTGQQCLFFCYGTGRNGKSTLLETLMHIWGEYAMKAPTGMIMQKYQTGIPNDIARLVTKRLVVAAEIEENKRLDEALVKDLTGGDVLTARFLREEFFDFQPTHKLWIYGNHKPEIRGTDPGIWRRIRVIPFEVQIPPAEVDRRLKARLINEAPGILAWAVRGCLQWQAHGLGEPEIVERATADYRAEMDQVQTFISEQCVMGAQYAVRAGMLYQAYKKWAEESGEYTYSQQRFGRKLGERGLVRRQSTDADRHWRWVGIGLLETKHESMNPSESFFHVTSHEDLHVILHGKKDSEGFMDSESEPVSELPPPGKGISDINFEAWQRQLQQAAPDLYAAGWQIMFEQGYRLVHPDRHSTQLYMTLQGAIREARGL